MTTSMELYWSQPSRREWERDERCPRCGERSDPQALGSFESNDDYERWPLWKCTKCIMPYRYHRGEDISKEYCDYWTKVLENSSRIN